jgi:hypothetical protein
MIESLRLDRVATRVDLRDFTARIHGIFTSTRCRLMGGHWRVLHTTRNRVCLRCVACGNESPGWEVRPKTTGIVR